MRHIAVFLIIVLGFVQVLFSAPKAFACSCSGWPPSEAFENSNAVFTGTVTGIQHNTGRYDVQFSVDEAWKGVSDSQANITTSDNDGTCGYDFQQGIKYIVYAYGSEESLQTGICSRTQPVADAYKDLAYLGEGYVPVAGQPIIEKTPSSPFLPFVGIGVVVAGVIAFFTLRNRRN